MQEYIAVKCNWDAIAQRIEIDYSVDPIHWRFAENKSFDELKEELSNNLMQYINSPYTERQCKSCEESIEDILRKWMKQGLMLIVPFRIVENYS